MDAKDKEPKESKTCYQEVTKSEWTMSKEGSGSIGNSTCRSLRCLLEKYKKEQEVHPKIQEQCSRKYQSNTLVALAVR